MINLRQISYDVVVNDIQAGGFTKDKYFDYLQNSYRKLGVSTWILSSSEEEYKSKYCKQQYISFNTFVDNCFIHSKHLAKQNLFTPYILLSLYARLYDVRGLHLTDEQRENLQEELNTYKFFDSIYKNNLSKSVSDNINLFFEYE